MCIRDRFCDEHDPAELEDRPLKRYEIPASKLVLELGYSIDYEAVSYTHLDVYKRQARGGSDQVFHGQPDPPKPVPGDPHRCLLYTSRCV